MHLCVAFIAWDLSISLRQQVGDFAGGLMPRTVLLRDRKIAAVGFVCIAQRCRHAFS
jgi:hypothetical protein